jgi:hypothetical protein
MPIAMAAQTVARRGRVGETENKATHDARIEQRRPSETVSPSPLARFSILTTAQTFVE